MNTELKIKNNDLLYTSLSHTLFYYAILMQAHRTTTLQEIAKARKAAAKELQALKQQAMREIAKNGGYYWNGNKYTSERSFYAAKNKENDK